MKKFQRMTALLLALGTVLALAACGGKTEQPATDAPDNASADPKQTIMVAHWFAEDHPIHESLKEFEATAERLSNGSLQIDLYPNAQLGSEDTYIDAIKQGTVQMGITGTMIAKYHPVIYAQETPFLFSGWEDAYEVLNGEVSEFVKDGFEENSGMVLLGTMVNGFREFSSNKTMYSLGEFKGQRIRVPNVPHYIEMVKALGASPIAMSLTDLFPALEQKAVDGQDNPYPTDAAQSFDEVQDYILESRHMFSPANVVINSTFYNKTLTGAQREAFDAAIAAAIAHNWEISEEEDNVAKQELMDAGVEVTIPDEAYVKELQAAMDPVYTWFFENVEGAKEFIEATWAYQGK